MKALLLLSVLISLTSPALARIGETREQCEARYGKPVEVREDGFITVHEKSGLLVRCHYHEKICDYIIFSNLAKDAEGNPVPLTDSELKTLLEANSRGLPWTKGRDDTLTKNTFWDCGALLYAIHSTGPRATLSIGTNASVEHAKSMEVDRKKARLKDF